MTLVVEETQKTQAELLAGWFALRKTSRRHEIWLWLNLYYERIGDLSPESCGGLSMQGEIFGALSKAPHIRSDAIKADIDEQLVPDEQLSWITEDERQLSWLRRHLPLEVRGLPRGVVHLTDREHLIARLDLWNAALADKVDLIEDLCLRWSAYTAWDRDFEWFLDKKEGAARCKCAGEWLEENYPTFDHGPERVGSYQTLLMFFDQKNLTREKQQRIIRKIKQRWNLRQLQVRNPDSKQVNVMLAAETISQLDRLAKQHGVSRAKVVAKLIGNESELGLYLGE